MNNPWIKDIAVGALPEPFDEIVEAIEHDLREILPKEQKCLAAQLAHSFMLSMMAECEGEEIYFPRLDGDKLCGLRRGLIRREFRKLKGKRRNIYKALRKKFGGSDRSIRTAVKLDDEQQNEMFPEE